MPLEKQLFELLITTQQLPFDFPVSFNITYKKDNEITFQHVFLESYNILSTGKEEYYSNGDVK